MTSFGERLREIRIKAGETQAEAGEVFGLSAQGFSSYECGKREPSLEKLTQIADHYHVSIDWLLTGIETENTRTAKDLGLSNDAINVLRAIADETGQKEENRQVYELLKNAGVQVRENIPKPRSGFYLSENLRVIRVLNELLTTEKGLQVLRDMYVILFCAFRDAIVRDDTAGIGGLSSLLFLSVLLAFS